MQRHLTGGVAFGGKDDYDNEIADLNDAIHLAPRLAKAFYYFALAYGSKRDDKKEMADFNEAVRLDPADPEAFHDRGVVRSSGATTTAYRGLQRGDPPKSEVRLGVL